MSEEDLVEPLVIIRDPDRERAEATEQTLVAAGAMLPSGTIYIEWNREAFEEENRAENVVTSRYESVDDAEEATRGNIVFETAYGEREVWS